VDAAQSPQYARFELVSAETQPVSGRSLAQISDIENLASRDTPPESRLSVSKRPDSWPETGILTANLRKCGLFAKSRRSPERDRCGWLGTQSRSNRSPRQFPCQQGNYRGIFAFFPLPYWLRKPLGAVLQRLVVGFPQSGAGIFLRRSREIIVRSRDFFPGHGFADFTSPALRRSGHAPSLESAVKPVARKLDQDNQRAPSLRPQSSTWSGPGRLKKS
jgi:hypothetical protein